MGKHKKTKKTFMDMLQRHVYNNLKIYVIIAIIFVIGIIIGIIIANNSQNEYEEQLNDTIANFLSTIKENESQIDYINYFRNEVTSKIAFIAIIWFLGCSVIGIPVVYLLLVYKGFSLGYTISSIILTLGTGKGILFVLITMFFQNILIIPATFGASVSGVNLYKSIMKNKRIENIKIEILRHTIFCLIMFFIIIIATFIEVYLSSFFIRICVNFF